MPSKARAWLCAQRVVAGQVAQGRHRRGTRGEGQLRTQLACFVAVSNFVRRLQTRGGVTPHAYICKIWISEPIR